MIGKIFIVKERKLISKNIKNYYNAEKTKDKTNLLVTIRQSQNRIKIINKELVGDEIEIATEDNWTPENEEKNNTLKEINR